MRLLVSGKFLTACRSSRSQEIVVTPRASSHRRCSASEKRLTARIFRSCPAACAARRAKTARVGAILPPTPRISNGMDKVLITSTSAGRGRVSHSSSCSSVSICSGKGGWLGGFIGLRGIISHFKKKKEKGKDGG